MCVDREEKGPGKCPQRVLMHSLRIRLSDWNLISGPPERAKRLTILWCKSVACFMSIMLFINKWKVPFTSVRVYWAPTASHGYTWKYGYCITISTTEIMQCRLENAGMIVTAKSEELLHDEIPNNCTASLDNDLDGLRKTKKNSTVWDLRFAQRCWRFGSSGMWHCVAVWVVPYFSKGCGAFKH